MRTEFFFEEAHFTERRARNRVGGIAAKSAACWTNSSERLAGSWLPAARKPMIGRGFASSRYCTPPSVAQHTAAKTRKMDTRRTPKPAEGSQASPWSESERPLPAAANKLEEPPLQPPTRPFIEPNLRLVDRVEAPDAPEPPTMRKPGKQMTG